MIDMHAHIIYGVDDGPKTIKESYEMIKRASQAGITDIVCTPHYISNSSFSSEVATNREKRAALVEKLHEFGLQMNLYGGTEIYFDEDPKGLFQAKKIESINHGTYLLTEVPRQKMNYESLLNYIFQLEVMGYRVILAHPERYDFIVEDPNKAKALIQRDVLLQINASSLVGKYGKKIQETAKIMLEHGMVHMIASDAHRPQQYDQLEEGFEVALRHTEDDTFNDLVLYTPQKILRDEMFYPEPPIQYKKNFFGFLRRRKKQ